MNEKDPVLPEVEERTMVFGGPEGALGETFEIPIGPIHPALKEPIRLTFRVRGERIVGVEIRTGFAHRGIEFMGMRQGRNLIQILYLAERICGICSVSHPIAFTQAVERAAGIEVPPRAQYIRVIISELERIHSHLLWAGVAAHELGFDTLLHLTWRVREKVLDILEELSGNRIDYAIPIFGGVRRDITPEQYPKVWEALRYYRGLLEQLLDAFLNDPTVRARTRGVGVLEPKEAEELCAVGPTARASGLRKVVRQDRPYLAYSDFEVKALTPEDYGLTPKGEEAFWRWALSPVPRVRLLRYELVPTLFVLLTLSPERVPELLFAQKEVLLALRDRVAAEDPTDPFQRALRSFRLHQLSAGLRWLEELLAQKEGGLCAKP